MFLSVYGSGSEKDGGKEIRHGLRKLTNFKEDFSQNERMVVLEKLYAMVEKGIE